MLNDKIAAAALACNLELVYARKKESEIIVDKAKKFPVIVRAFAEDVMELNNGSRSRSCMFYVADSMRYNGDTATQVAPICSAMEDRAFAFIAALRGQGIDVTLTKMVTASSNLYPNSNETGVIVFCTLKYRTC